MSPTTTQPSATKRRPSTKRPIFSSSEEDPGDTRFQPPPGKRARTAETDDSQVDVVGAPADDRRFLPGGTPSPSHPTQSKNKNTRKSVSSGPRPKLHVVHSDDHDDDGDYAADASIEDDPVDVDVLSSDLDDDSFEVDSTAKRGATKTTSSKSTSTKGKLGASKSTKGKGHKEKEKAKEVLIKDERKLPAPSSTAKESSNTAHTLPPELAAQEELASVAPSTSSKSVSDTVVTQGPTDKDSANPPVPKKRKLPTISKTKQPSTVGTTPTSNNPPGTAKSSCPPSSTDNLVKAPLPTIQQRKTALSGTQDFDLRQPNIYAELFKPGGGSTPGSSLTRREKEEERRKELNRMRDEARAKRAEEAKVMFDLQAQAEKIARFERRLRAENSSVLHPNFLAAKFRDEWEMERRRQRDDRGTSRDEGDTHSIAH
ncbi:hypothetical protein EV401DRAFT_2076587 [Pisolithus croceorrhizus]|nr:hypothetical protein EV401DRAFT_2076587 [Pisolithus croceorrhizus]